MHRRVVPRQCGSGNAPANMCLQTVLAVLYFSTLAAVSSSAEVVEFRWLMSDDGKLLCGMTAPNKTLNAVGTRLECMVACNRGCKAKCQAFNYHQTAKRCELFDYEPCSYAEQEDCVIYKVVFSFRNLIALYSRRMQRQSPPSPLDPLRRGRSRSWSVLTEAINSAVGHHYLSGATFPAAGHNYPYADISNYTASRQRHIILVAVRKRWRRKSIARAAP